MREFSTAVNAELAHPEQSEDSGFPIDTRVDGRPLRLHPMSSSQFVVVAHALDSGSVMSNAAGLLNAFFAMLKDEKEIRHYKQRLWNEEDPFGVGTIVDIMKEAVAEWSGNPTQRSTASSVSLPSTGSPSTLPPQQSEPPVPFVSGQTGS